ncbi:MAG: YdcH family protein [Nitratireductor sp.]
MEIAELKRQKLVIKDKINSLRKATVFTSPRIVEAFDVFCCSIRVQPVRWNANAGSLLSFSSGSSGHEIVCGDRVQAIAIMPV